MRNCRRAQKAIVLCALLALFACDRSPQPANNAVRHYNARGIIRGFAPDHTTVEIEHEAIPEFMPAMTMPFTARDAKAIANLRSGDAISFRIDVTDREVSIAEVKKIAETDVHLPTAAPLPPIGSTTPRLREGDAMPEFQLTNEAGERISLETFRGRPWIITFIFTRCPMPDFCPRMAKNFSELQKAIQTGQGVLSETRLLSITIDPEYDTPAVLKAYREQEGADSKIWSFATGDPAAIDDLTKSFAVYRQNEGGTISHGLTTALIDGEGKVVKIWRGNGWMIEEIVHAVEARE